MNSPITRRIGNVFVPVSDMGRAVAWYSTLLGLPVHETSHAGTIYDVPMEGETGLILDATPRVGHNSSQPLFFFWTADIAATYRSLQEHGVEILSEVQDIGSVSMLVFRDPDGNLLMVCERNG